MKILKKESGSKNNSYAVEDVVYYLFRRKNLLVLSQQILDEIDSAIILEYKIDLHDKVSFVHDCYRQALNKALRLNFGQTAIRQLTSKSKDYDRFCKLVPLLEENRINPFAFFSFIVEVRRTKRIPCVAANVATKNAVDHFLDFQKKNTYKVQTYLTFRDHEKTLYNQLKLDLESLTTYLLRKPNVAISEQDLWLLSLPSRVILASNKELQNLNAEEGVFYEDLLFDPDFKKRLFLQWNQYVTLQLQKINSMHHELRDEKFRNKIDKVASVLVVLKVQC